MKVPVRKCYQAGRLAALAAAVLLVLGGFERWRGGRRAARALRLGPDELEYERQIAEDEARIVPGLGAGGAAAHLVGEAKRLGELSEKELAINVYLSDRIPYNRTLKDHRNPACKRVLYDAELPSASVIIIFHNEPYSVVVRTIWSVVNSVRRDQPWYSRANFVDRETGKVMTLGYPGQEPTSPHVYLKEIILVDDNSTLPELKGKLSHYIRTRLPPGLVRLLRLPDRVGLTQAKLAGSRHAVSDVLVFLDAHCEVMVDWLRPLLHRIKESRTAVLTPVIDMLEQDTFLYESGGPGIQARLAGARFAAGEVLVFLDAHCEGQQDWLRPLLQRIKEAPHAVVVPIIDVIEASNFYYSVQDPKTFQGLMRARMRGARAARGEVLVFLDAHCEAGADWLRPLLARAAHKRDAVLTPLIDVVDQTTFRLDAAQHFQVGGFTFMGHFTWVDVPEWEKKRRGSDIAPTWSPTMAGGLFAMSRAYFWELGAYDEQMAGWGGENLEMSFRVWQCGGTLETIPCSRVGHVFRSFHPYGLPANTDTHGINTARMADVWMDEYAELFYLHRPDLRGSARVGDVTHRRVLREKLQCRSFRWYLDTVYRDKFVPVRDVAAYGRFRNPLTGLCLDTLQRDAEGAPLGLYACHDRLAQAQYFALSHRRELRDEERCAEPPYFRRAPAEGETRRVLMMGCHGKLRGQQWRYTSGSGQLQHVQSGLCLAAPADAAAAAAAGGGEAVVARCSRAGGEGAAAQQWLIDYTEENGFGVKDNAEPSEQQLRLQKIRGRRRTSRSLLSREEEARRRHRKPRRKNKFLLKLVRDTAGGGAGVGGGGEEHLEAALYCRHRRLLPNDSFVRDIVAILNDRDVKVINNGRLFERNRVTQLGKHELKVLDKMPLPDPGANPTPDPTTAPVPAPVPAPAKHWPPKKHKRVESVQPDVPPPAGAGAPPLLTPVVLTKGEGSPRSPQNKIIVEDFVEVTPATDAPVQPKRSHKRGRAPPRRRPAPAPPAQNDENSRTWEAAAEDGEAPMLASAERRPREEAWRAYSSGASREETPVAADYVQRAEPADGKAGAGGAGGSGGGGGVRLVVRSNVTLRLGEELFQGARGAGDVARLLGELVLPLSTPRPHHPPHTPTTHHHHHQQQQQQGEVTGEDTDGHEQGAEGVEGVEAPGAPDAADELLTGRGHRYHSEENVVEDVSSDASDSGSEAR